MADFPNILPSSIKWNLVPNTQKFTSGLSGHVQVSELAGAKWNAELTFSRLSDDTGRDLTGFLASLSGSATTFNLPHHGNLTPRGIATGTPLVSGAGQSGSSLVTDGWTPSQTGIMLRGDLFQVGTELKILTADSNSDGSGFATLNFKSPLRAVPADNAAIIITSPKALMQLSDDKQASDSMSVPVFHTLRIRCIEAL